jgi:hypothetical protein
MGGAASGGMGGAGDVDAGASGGGEKGTVVEPSRGVVVQTLILADCTNYQIVETLELAGSSSAPSLSRHGLSSAPCQDLSLSADANVLRVTNVLNPAEVFAAMERKLND